MKVEEIIRQAEHLSAEEQKQLLGYFFFKFIGADKEKLMSLLAKKDFLYKDEKKDLPLFEKAFDKFRGAAEHLWNEDAQEYVNKLREDEREF